MRFLSRAIALSLAVAVRATKVDILEAIDDEEDVLVLTNDNFEEAVESADTLLVEFYSPNCGHCKRAEPEYAKAASELRQLENPIYIAKVDATKETELAQRYKIEGYPTFKFFTGSTDYPKDYTGERTAESFVKWVKKYSGPLVSYISSIEELEELKSSNEVVLFAVTESEEGNDRKVLETLASSEERVVFAATTDTKLSSDCDKHRCVVLFKKFDEGKHIFEDTFSEDSIKNFLNQYKRQLVVKFSDESASTIFGGDITTHVLLFTDTSSDDFPNLETKFTEAAKKNRDKLLHVVVESSEKRLVEYFGFQENDFPAVLLLSVDGALKKYSFPHKSQALLDRIDSNFVSELNAFEADFFAGKLTPELKSAEPEDDSDENVKVIVGKQFMERVIETDKDVLLEFYAPWCGHCKQLAPIYEELAEKFSSVDSIMIAKMDATANEIDYPKVDIKGFPTIIFFPANDKKNPIVYESSRDLEGFTEFLKKNARKFEHEGETFGVDHDEL